MSAKHSVQQSPRTSTSENTRKENKIFISWSGSYSKDIANAIKELLENSVFSNQQLTCFVSDLDIAPGSNWWNELKKELKSCKMGIICITKDNLLSPWLYFESGAMISKGIKAIPLLFNCDINSLVSTPLNASQAVDFNNQKHFIRMLSDINKKMGFNISESQIIALGKDAHVDLGKKLEHITQNLKDIRKFNTKYVFPHDVNIVKKNTIFICAPMSNIPPDEYASLRESVLKIKDLLLQIGFTEVHCPLIDIESQDRFDGKSKAIDSNYHLMKQVDSMLFIYPWKIASSALIEMGYGLALSKRMAVFYFDGLPYIMEEAAMHITNIMTYKVSTYKDIYQKIERNGMHIFKGAFDE